MRRMGARIFGVLLVIAALAASTPRAEAKKVCNLLCIQGFHCCIVKGHATCVPETQPCK